MIVVVEDERAILDVLERGLGRQGFELSTATDGLTGLEMALDPTTDLVVLDLKLPRMDGHEVLAELRCSRPELPVIVLTGHDALGRRVSSLEAGAVDYMVKPFALDELGARIRAQLRLAHRGETALEAGGVHADLISRQVRVADQDLRLTTTEFELLTYLMRREGTIVARDLILRDVWGYHHDPGSNIVEVYIGYVRRKLIATGAPNPIETIRSRGYRFTGQA